MSDGNETLLGRVAVAAKAITLEQLNIAVREHGKAATTTTLGEVLVELGFLTAKKLDQVVKLQKQVIEKSRAQRAAAEQPKRKAPPEAGPATVRISAPVPARTAAPARAKPVASAASAPPAAKREPAVVSGDTSALDAILRDAAAAGASDIHVHSSAPLRFRVRGTLYDHGSEPIGAEQAAKLLLPALSELDRGRFEELGEQDFCYALPGVGRFRANVYRQLRGTDGAFRFIAPEPPTLDSLGLPSMLAKFTTFHQGMVLLTGPASCGKSSTMSALVNLINEEREEHILTIEDPIECLHNSKRCLVNQRTVRRHTESFGRALRAALREDPDVIVIGELRDRETIALALSAAETGHFVLATLHTDNAIGTVNRLVGAFPPDQQDQVRSMLSESLKAVISQRLLPSADEQGMVPALEVMIVNRPVGNLIREQKTVQIHSVLQTGSSQGMCLLDHSLAQLVSSGRVSREVALKVCEDAKYIPG